VIAVRLVVALSIDEGCGYNSSQIRTDTRRRQRGLREGRVGNAA